MKDIKRKGLWKLHKGNETCVMKTHYQCRLKNLPSIFFPQSCRCWNLWHSPPWRNLPRKLRGKHFLINLILYSLSITIYTVLKKHLSTMNSCPWRFSNYLLLYQRFVFNRSFWLVETVLECLKCSFDYVLIPHVLHN